MPKISVIIPLFNKGFIISETLNSVLVQTFIDFEVVIIDDGSTDNSFEVVSQFSDKRIKLFQQKNKGAASARNVGIERATGELIAFLDADDYWFPNHLEELYQLYIDFPNCGVYCSKYQIKNTKNTLITPFFKGIPADFIGIVTNYFTSNHPYKINITLNQLIPKKVLIEMGCFTEGVTNGQDLELWTKIALKYPVAIHHKSTAIYNYYLPNTLSKNSIKTMKLMDFNQFNEAEKQNVDLKHFLDLHRIFYAKHYKIVGDYENVDFYLKDVNKENISIHMKLFFITPSFILNGLFHLKKWLKQI